MSEPREFVIIDNYEYRKKHNSFRCIEIVPNETEIAKTDIHVIEKSAYDELKILLKAEQDAYHGASLRELKAKAQADKLAEALEFIHEHSTLTDKGRDDLIKQALKEYRGKK